jgi:hypothetical protein
MEGQDFIARTNQQHCDIKARPALSLHHAL